jgi:hypothetical protein
LAKPSTKSSVLAKMAPFSPSGRVCQLYCDADQSGAHEGLKPGR